MRAKPRSLTFWMYTGRYAGMRKGHWPRDIQASFSSLLWVAELMGVIARHHPRLARSGDRPTVVAITDSPEQLLTDLRCHGLRVDVDPVPKISRFGPRANACLEIVGAFPTRVLSFPTEEASFMGLHRGLSVDEVESVLREWHSAAWMKYLRGTRSTKGLQRNYLGYMRSQRPL